MTIWTPELRLAAGPKYLALADAIALDLKAGRLGPGTRLPTHRELARRLGVTVGTVTRGYDEARRRGLVSGEVGRGTFVRSPRPEAVPVIDHVAGASGRGIDLSFNLPSMADGADLLRAALVEAAGTKDLAGLLRYQPYAGVPRHRAAGAKWLGERGLEAGPDEILVTAGAQHGMLLAFSVLCEPGDLVLTEGLTYQGMKALARLLHLRLEGLPMDEEGLRPDALEEACRKGAPKALYCTPTIQNPTARVMGEKRRRDIAAILLAHRLPVVEDDIYSYLVDAPPPLAALCGDLAYYVTSLSKSLAPGLRVGWLRAPRAAIDHLAASMMTTSVMASPLTAEVASRMVSGGGARSIVARQRKEMRARQGLARKILDGHVAEGSHAGAPHLWLQLPEPWRAEEFARAAKTRGVIVASAETFAVGRGAAPHAARISLCAPQDEATLDRALRVLADLLDGPPPPSAAGV